MTALQVWRGAGQGASWGSGPIQWPGLSPGGENPGGLCPPRVGGGVQGLCCTLGMAWRLLEDRKMASCRQTRPGAPKLSCIGSEVCATWVTHTPQGGPPAILSPPSAVPSPTPSPLHPLFLDRLLSPPRLPQSCCSSAGGMVCLGPPRGGRCSHSKAEAEQTRAPWPPAPLSGPRPRTAAGA